MVNRPADAEAQQTAISEALWRVMSRGGPQSLSLRAVAAEAGCTTGLVTSRFPNKQALLIHARQMLDERTSRAMDAVEADIDDPREALRRLLEISVLGDEFDSRVWLGYLAATLSDPDLAEVQVEANHGFLEAVERLLVRARPGLAAAEVTTSAIGIVSLVTGVAALSTADPAHYSAVQMRRLIDRVVAAV